MEKDALINFADLTSRERLEFEVSQLADGTLSASRRAVVMAEVARDESLQAMLRDFEQIDARLARQPDWSAIDLAGLEHDVMDVVKRDMAAEDLSIPLRLPAAATAATSDTARTSWWVNPWTSAVAAAAALVIGVGLGVAVMNSGDQGTLQVVTSDPGSAMADGELLVVGPGQMHDASSLGTDINQMADAAVLSVSGPGESTFTDLVAVYSGAGSVMDVPSRVIVASVDGSSETGE